MTDLMDLKEWACLSIIFYKQEKVMCDASEEEVHCNEG